METDKRDMRRLKWIVFGISVLLSAGIQIGSHLIWDTPPLEGVVDWVIGAILAALLIQAASWHVTRIYARLQAEAAERARTEQDLRESDRRFRQLADNIKEVFWLRDAERFLYISPAYEEIWGRPRETLYQDPGAHLDVLLPEDRERVLSEYEPEQMLNDEPLTELFRVVHPDGSVRWVQTKSFPVRNEAGEVDMRAGISEDVTDQVRTERALRRRVSELALLNRATRAFGATLDVDRVLASVLEETRDLLDVVASSIWLLDPDTGDLVCQLATGPQREMVQGWRLAPGEGLAGWVLRTGESLIVPDAQQDERYYAGVDRTTRLELHAILTVPLCTNEDTVGVIQVLDTAVGRFGPADRALLESLAASAAIAIDNARLYQETNRLRTFNEDIVQGMQEGIVLEDDAGRIAFVNPTAAELLGYAPDELLGQHYLFIAPPERIDQIQRESSQRPQGAASRYETLIMTKEGERLPVIVSAKPLFEEGTFAGVLSVFTDIRERVRAERELRASENKYRELVERINDVIYAVDNEGVLTYISPVIETLTGYTPAELSGHPFFKVVHPDDRPAIRDNYHKVMSGQAQVNEYRLVNKTGEIRWARTSSQPVLDEGEIVGVRGVLSDITGRVRADQQRRALEEQLERARRIESLGTLAGGVAHDLNNILGPMVAYPDLILESLPPQSPLCEDVREIQRSAQRAAAVVQDLLALARRGVYQMMPVDLNHVIREYVRSPSFAALSAEHPQVAVDVDLDPDLLYAAGSAAHLSKVVMNLVTNAFEAMPDGGRLAISTASESLDRPHAGYERVKAGDYVVLRVIDNGIGIEQEDLPRLFEPFYTKKEMGRSGTGLGLAVVWGVAQDHQAKIDVTTAVGAGTTFALYLPVSREALPAHDEREEDHRGSERVLVVDDLEEQRALAVRLLSSLGYEVAAVESGRAAIAYLRDHSADIVVLDMIMEEGFDGLDAYRQICQIRPGQRAIIASGFSKTKRVKEAQRLGAGPFVRKPYTLRRLGRAVREELDRPSPPLFG